MGIGIFKWVFVLSIALAHGAEPKRAELLARMEVVMGPLPKERCPLDVQVTEEVDCGSYVRKFLTYQSAPGERVPAYLLIPKDEKTLTTAFSPSDGARGSEGKALSALAPKRIGILTLHQTHAAGQKVVVGLGNSPNDEYGVELVKRGYICLAPAYPHLANYAPDLSHYRSGTMKAIWDNVRGLDLLAEYAGANPERFGAIGHSLGGHNSLFTAAFDERIKVVVTSCGFDSFRDYMNGNIKGWTSERYMPRLLEYAPDRYPFDFEDVLAAISPRGIFVSAPKRDSNFKWESVDRVVARASALAREMGNEPKIRVEHPDCEHSFPKEMREAAYQFMDAALKMQK